MPQHDFDAGQARAQEAKGDTVAQGQLDDSNWVRQRVDLYEGVDEALKKIAEQEYQPGRSDSNPTELFKKIKGLVNPG
jgi:hypothetical protein